MDTQGVRHLQQGTPGTRRARKLPSAAQAMVVGAATVFIFAAALLLLSQPAAVSPVALRVVELKCLQKTRNERPADGSYDYPYVVEYTVLLNRRDFPWRYRQYEICPRVESGVSRPVSPQVIDSSGDFDRAVHRPEDAIQLAAVMEFDGSSLGILAVKVIAGMRRATKALRDAGIDRSTMVARLIDEFDRVVRESAAATRNGPNPDDLVARPQDVRLNRLHVLFASRQATPMREVHHRGLGGHYVTIHRMQPE